MKTTKGRVHFERVYLYFSNLLESLSNVKIEDVLAKKELPALELEILLAALLNKDRSFLNAFPETALLSTHEKRLQRLIKRRITSEPLPYILGYKEFYGRSFLVNKAVLIPRPETEDLVTAVLKFAKNKPLTVLDVGTGSGAIAVTLLLEQPNLTIIASDIDPKTLQVARKNARLHQVGSKIKFIQSDLLAKIDQSVDIIATNLPYVPTEKWKNLPSEIRDFEPRLALDSGRSALELYQKLFRAAQSKLNPSGKIIYEVRGEIFETSLANLVAG